MKLIELIPMAPQRDLIKTIRRDKFFIGTDDKNPLATELHRALTNLSMELYQNDMHFIKEIIQVTPTLVDAAIKLIGSWLCSQAHECSNLI